MATFIISCETQSPETKASVAELISALGESGTVTDGVWVIAVEATAIELRDKVKSLLSTGDRVFVIRSGREAAWNNLRVPGKWLIDHL